MGKKNLKTGIFGAICFATIIAAIALMASRSKMKCTQVINGQVQDCTGQDPDACPAAFAYEFKMDLMGLVMIEVYQTCPWNTSVLVVGFIALAFSLLFLVAFAWSVRQKSVKLPVFLLNAVALITLVVAVVLMIIDFKKGADFWNDSLKLMGLLGEVSYLPGPYIANIAIILAMILNIIIFVAIGMKINKKAKKRVNNIVRKIPNTSQSQTQPPQHGALDISQITSKHNDDSRMEDHSRSYGKVYKQPN